MGLRFLYPVYFIPEVEFTPHQDTANWVVERLRALLGRMGKTIFFRSGSEPLVLTEERRELRKQQRIDAMRKSSGLPPTLSERRESDVPELGRNVNHDFQMLFMRRQGLDNQEFYSLKSENDFKKSKPKKKTPQVVQVEERETADGLANDCPICMKSLMDSVIMPCQHMITCYDCSVLLLNRKDKCPICRDSILEVIKIFMT